MGEKHQTRHSQSLWYIPGEVLGSFTRISTASVMIPERRKFNQLGFISQMHSNQYSNLRVIGLSNSSSSWVAHGCRSSDEYWHKKVLDAVSLLRTTTALVVLSNSPNDLQHASMGSQLKLCRIHNCSLQRRSSSLNHRLPLPPLSLLVPHWTTALLAQR